MNSKLNLSSLLMVLSLLFSTQGILAQNISMPDLNGSGTADIVCASQIVGGNTHFVEATYRNAAGFNPGNDFILQLSDADGVFDNVVANNIELARINNLSTPAPSPTNLDFGNFSMPTNVRGENYSIRIVTTDPEMIGDVATNIPLYYFDSSEPILLTGPSDSPINAALCPSQAIDLSVTPSDFPSYTWLRNGIEIPGENESTLSNVTQAGIYRVRIDFGSCNPRYAFNESNTINVIDFTQANVFINEAPAISYCPEDVKVLNCNISDTAFTYEWFKDGVAIENSNTPSLTLPQSNFQGNYHVNVRASDQCNVNTSVVTVTNLGSNILTQPPPQLILLPGEILTLEITTDAPAGSTFQWFRNGIAITGETGLSITTNAPATYRVEVVTNDVCGSTLVAETEIFIPTDFNVVIGHDGPIDCNAEDADLVLEDIFGITGAGIQVPLIPTQITTFDLEWFRDGVTTGDTDSNYTVASIDENGTYSMEATFSAGGFDTDVSNDLIVSILPTSIQITGTPDSLPVGGTVVLTVPLVDGYTYQWFRIIDGTETIIDGATNNTIDVQELGEYYVIVTAGECETRTDNYTVTSQIVFSGIIPNVVTPNGDNINENWTLPTELVNQQDVEITIYDIQGKVDFTATNYQNNWPEENSKSLGRDAVYYYIITKNNSVVRKGSITVMR